MPGPTAVDAWGWWKADAISAADGDPLTQWDDSTGNARHLTGGSPSYQTAELNGLPVVRFDGTDDNFSVAVSADASRTVFVVAKQTADAASKAVVGWPNNNNAVLGRGATATWCYPGQLGEQSLGGTPTNWTIVTLRFNDAASLDGYLDGGSATNFDPADAYSTATNMRVGARGDGTQRFWNGDVAEVVVYDTALSDTDREDVYDALFLKWFTVVADPPSLHVVRSNLRLA
jgi:hypothetical protein